MPNNPSTPAAAAGQTDLFEDSITRHFSGVVRLSNRTINGVRTPIFYRYERPPPPQFAVSAVRLAS